MSLPVGPASCEWSECWMFYTVPTARVIFYGENKFGLIQSLTKTSLDLFSLG